MRLKYSPISLKLRSTGAPTMYQCRKCFATDEVSAWLTMAPWAECRRSILAEIGRRFAEGYECAVILLNTIAAATSPTTLLTAA